VVNKVRCELWWIGYHNSDCRCGDILPREGTTMSYTARAAYGLMQEMHGENDKPRAKG